MYEVCILCLVKPHECHVWFMNIHRQMHSINCYSILKCWEIDAANQHRSVADHIHSNVYWCMCMYCVLLCVLFIMYNVCLSLYAMSVSIVFFMSMEALGRGAHS